MAAVIDRREKEGENNSTSVVLFRIYHFFLLSHKAFQTHCEETKEQTNKEDYRSPESEVLAYMTCQDGVAAQGTRPSW